MNDASVRTPRRVWSFAEELGNGADIREVLGGKGASLNQMFRAGLNVPPGFTISAACCRSYFENGRRWPDGLECEIRGQLARLEHLLNRTYGVGPRPLLVSVRSGAAVSMPGMMDTILNCGLNPRLAVDLGDRADFNRIYAQFITAFARTADHLTLDADSADALLAQYHERTGHAFPTDPWEMLRRCINAVFESWLSPRATAYRTRHALEHLHGTAVSVQAMFPSEVSGVLFTQDPTNVAANRIVIESAYGLGESVVSGDLTPDQFRVSRDDLTQIDAQLGHKASAVWALGDHRLSITELSLSNTQVGALCKLGLQVESYFGHPVDIEWGLCEGQFALLQARPIRGLEATRAAETFRLEEIARLRHRAGTGRHVWVTHNLGETLRAPTPLTWDIVRQFMSGEGGFGRLYRQLGYRPAPELACEGFLELICGRIYADPERLARLFWDGLPLTYDLDSLRQEPALINQAPTRFDANRADGRFLLQLPANLLSMRRVARNVRNFRLTAADRFERDILPPYLTYVKQKRDEDLQSLSDVQLLDELELRRQRVLDDFGCESLLPGFLGGLAWDALQTRLVQLMGPEEGGNLANQLVGGLEGDTTIEQNNLLFAVAQGKRTLSEFMDRFGHRCMGEMELSTPRWREEPSYIQQMIILLKSAAKHDPIQMHEQKVQQRMAAEAELPGRLRHWGGSSFREDIERDLRDAQRLLPYREIGKHYLMMGYELLRQPIEEVARRWQLGRDVWFHNLGELRQAAGVPGKLADCRTSERRARWQALQRFDVPDVVDAECLDMLGLSSGGADIPVRPDRQECLPREESATASESTNELTGTCISNGVAEGTARVVLSPADAVALGQDTILVCPSTDPGWTPLFLAARGLVMEKGGVLSHGAIVARDFGIPAIVCPNVTRLLVSGDRVRIDANQGRIQILKKA